MPRLLITAGIMQTETLYYGDRKISIRTSVLEEKATACNMLCCYADELEVGFFPYVEQVRHHDILIGLICFNSKSSTMLNRSTNRFTGACINGIVCDLSLFTIHSIGTAFAQAVSSPELIVHGVQQLMFCG